MTLATDAAPLAAWVPAKAPVMGSRPQGEGIGAERERVRRVRRASRVEGRGSMVAGWCWLGGVGCSSRTDFGVRQGLVDGVLDREELDGELVV